MKYCVVFQITAILWPALMSAQSIDDLIAQAEAKDAVMDTKGAMVLYKEAEKLAPSNVKVLIGLSKQYGESMVDATDASAKKKSGEVALSYAKKAAMVDPESSDAQLSVAICYGRLLELVGAKEKVQFSRFVKDHADAAIRLDPKSDYAWHMLGRWHRGVADIKPIVRGIAKIVYGGIPSGSNAEAVSSFRKAIDLKPDRLVHYIELGLALIATGNETEGRAAIQRGLAMPNRERDDPSSKRRGTEALSNL